jgi:hypothetical protein
MFKGTASGAYFSRPGKSKLAVIESYTCIAQSNTHIGYREFFRYRIQEIDYLLLNGFLHEKILASIYPEPEIKAHAEIAEKLATALPTEDDNSGSGAAG